MAGKPVGMRLYPRDRAIPGARPIDQVRAAAPQAIDGPACSSKSSSIPKASVADVCPPQAPASTRWRAVSGAVNNPGPHGAEQSSTARPPHGVGRSFGEDPRSRIRAQPPLCLTNSTSTRTNGTVE